MCCTAAKVSASASTESTAQRKGQPYGKRAKQAVSELVFGKEVTLQTFGKDKYGRTIANVLLSDGTSVNRQLVKVGLLLLFVRWTSLIGWHNDRG